MYRKQSHNVDSLVGIWKNKKQKKKKTETNTKKKVRNQVIDHAIAQENKQIETYEKSNISKQMLRIWNWP